MLVNHLYVLWKLFPNEEWDYFDLSIDSNITLDDILDNPNSGWDWHDIAWNSGIKVQVVLRNLSHPVIIKNWRWDMFSRNKNVTIEHLLDQSNLPNGTSIPWSWREFSSNPNLKLQHILDYPEIKSKLDMDRFTSNPGITFAEAIAHPEYEWDWYTISQCQIITIDDLVDHPEFHEKLNWNRLSRSKYISFQDIVNHPELPWRWYGVSANPNVCIRDILDYRGREWDWPRLSLYANITLRDVIEHPDLPWDRQGVAMNSNITFQDTQTIFQFRNIGSWIFAHNKNLTFRDVLHGEFYLTTHAELDRKHMFYGLSGIAFNRSNAVLIVQRLFRRRIRIELKALISLREKALMLHYAPGEKHYLEIMEKWNKYVNK